MGRRLPPAAWLGSSGLPQDNGDNTLYSTYCRSAKRLPAWQGTSGSSCRQRVSWGEPRVLVGGWPAVSGTGRSFGPSRPDGTVRRPKGRQRPFRRGSNTDVLSVRPAAAAFAVHEASRSYPSGGHRKADRSISLYESRCTLTPPSCANRVRTVGPRKSDFLRPRREGRAKGKPWSDTPRRPRPRKSPRTARIRARRDANGGNRRGGVRGPTA